MELIWGIWFFFGLIVGVVVAIAACSDREERYVSNNKRKSHRHNCVSCGTNDGGGYRRSNNRHNLQMDKREIRDVINVHRIGASIHEKLVFDALLEMVGGEDDD